jgi:hypothetical protein
VTDVNFRIVEVFCGRVKNIAPLLAVEVLGRKVILV